MVSLAFVVALPGCLTCKLLRLGPNDRSGVLSEPSGPAATFSGADPAVVLVFIAITFTFDVVSFPFQYLMGYYPYGHKT